MMAWFGSNVSVPPAYVACWSILVPTWAGAGKGRQGKGAAGTSVAWQKDRRSSPLNGVHDGWH